MLSSRAILPCAAFLGCLLGSCASTSGKDEKPSPAGQDKNAPPAEKAAPSRPEPWTKFTTKLSGEDLVDRFVEASGLLLGVPYVNGPLGEGEAGGPDPEPRYDLTRADCVTYLEESLALALTAPRSDRDYVPILDAIRYRDGEVGFASRNHYMVLDWIPSNSWLLEDVTEEVAPEGRTKEVEKNIDRAAFLRDQGVAPRPGVDEVEEVDIELIAIEDIAAAGPALKDGDLVFWVAKKDGIDIAHTGMVVRNPKDGSLLHRHGSSKAGISLDEPLLEYAERVAPVFEGIVVLRLKPDAVPPGISASE